MNYITDTIQPYLDYLPYFFIAVMTAFLLTPFIGLLANKLGIVDLPANLRKATDKTKSTRIRKDVVVRAGAIAVVLPITILTLFTTEIDKQIVAIILGVILLTTIGILDDKFQLSGKYQIIVQILAALIVVAAGISIDSIRNPLGNDINLRSIVVPFNFASQGYSIALPADIITIIWILIMMNAVNWIFGIDSLGEGISIISFLTILFIGVKYDSPVSALIACITAGALIGFFPFNIHPSKIISGSSVVVYGFLISVLSIIGGVKVSTSIIVLAIPIMDMIWVMIGRINRHGIKNILDVFKVTSIGDDTHLHHRLLKLGLTVPQVALVECLAVGICAIIAFTTADLPKVTTVSVIGVFVLTLFLGVSILLKNGIKLRKEKQLPERKVPEKTPDDTPESRYAY